MLILACIIVGLFLCACLGLVGVWVYYFKRGMRLCDEIGGLGSGEVSSFPDDVTADAQECEFRAADGVRLRGSYLPTHALHRLGVIVFCHEFRADRTGAFRYLEGLRDEGFDVFTFDFRNHGDSDEKPGYTPRAWPTRQEVADVLAAVDYATSRPDADPAGVAVLGVSKGGGAALSAASKSRKIWAVVTDGAFVTVWVTASNMHRFLPRFTPLAPILLALPWVFFTFYAAIIQRSLAKKSQHDCVNLLSDIPGIRQPVLLIHGERDKTIPVELAPMLRRKIGKRCKLWIVPKARHNKSIHMQPDRYHRTVRRFLMKHVGAMEHASAPAAAGNGNGNGKRRRKTEHRQPVATSEA